MIKQQKIFTPEPGFPASFWIRSKLGFGRRPQLSSISYNMAQLCMRNSVFRGGPSSASSSPLPSTPSFLERDGSLIHGFWFRTRARMMHRFSHRRASRSPIIFGPKNSSRYSGVYSRYAKRSSASIGHASVGAQDHAPADDRCGRV